MALTIRAIYEAGHLRLLEAVPLDEGQEITITIDDPEIKRQADLAKLQALLEQEAYPGEQAETFDYLRQTLDENRPSGRKLFP
jgi:predicted DNA-binding antitoxin AbrB/MazE fold protein